MTNVGFFGMPGCGKSTVFRALTRQSVEPQFLSYDLKPHQAVVKIPEPRLIKLGELWKTRSIVHATMEFVDIPGFDPASTEQKLKNAVLEHYRKSDALALTLNFFEPEQAERAAGVMRNLLDELVLLGLITAENAAGRLEKGARLKADKETVAKYELLSRVKSQLEEGIPVRRMGLDPQESALMREYAFISEKPVIAVLNVADGDYAKPAGEIPGMQDVLDLAAGEGVTTVRMAASLEADLAGMDDAEAGEYLAEFGFTEPGLPRFIRVAFDALGLVTFLTASEKECRAWPLRRGTNAVGAAGVIHSDLARGFIRAETVSYDDYVQYGSMSTAKAAGKVRLEGKEYIVQDGDILLIRFNV